MGPMGVMVPKSSRPPGPTCFSIVANTHCSHNLTIFCISETLRVTFYTYLVSVGRRRKKHFKTLTSTFLIQNISVTTKLLFNCLGGINLKCCKKVTVLENLNQQGGFFLSCKFTDRVYL